MTKRILAFILALALILGQGEMAVLAADTPSVDRIVASASHVSSEGETISISVEGNGLTESNWELNIHTYNEYDISMNDRLKATIVEKTASGATIQIPENTMKNGMKYVIQAGVNEGNGFVAQAETTVTQDKMENSYQRTYRKVEMPDTKTIIITLDKAVDVSPVDKTKIFIANQGNENEGRRDLVEADTVTVDGNQITITLAEPFSAGVLSSIFIKKGAFKATENNVTYSVQMEYKSWSIVSKPSVSSIELSETVLDYKGGKITATLWGNRLQDAGSIVPKLSLAGELEKMEDMKIEVTPGENPTLSYVLPENNTERPVSYLLTVEVDGVEVYEGTVENPAKRAVVTVLPKGADANAPTLSAAAITGNNKLEGYGDNKNITVVVSKQVGELKTVMTIYGANMDSKVTKVRAVDENGIIWPVYDIPE